MSKYAFLALLACSAAHAAQGGGIQQQLEAALQPIIEKLAAKYECAVGVGIRHVDADPSRALAVQLAAGVADRKTKRVAGKTEKFIWGSVTKVVTGTAVLRLADQGVLTLEDSVPQHIDPFLAKMKAKDPSMDFSSLEELWGAEVNKVTVRDLLGMTSGVPDYDTASPTGREPTDSFRADAYAHPEKSYSPTQLLSVPWVRTKSLIFTPGVCDRHKYGNCYSSTNYVLLGLLLANHAGVGSWEEYDQHAAVKGAEDDFANMTFAVTGAPDAWSTMRGYDTTSYNNNTGAFDVSSVAGVFGGWTASDLVVDALDAATLADDVYGPQYKLASKKYVDQMYPASNLTGYGLSTFNLTRLTGLSGPLGVAYGHLGATYGYQSIIVHTPGLNLSFGVGTNIERDHQDQPQDVFCSVYGATKALLLGDSLPTCTFTPGYYDAGCKCVAPGAPTPAPAPGPSPSAGYRCYSFAGRHGCYPSRSGTQSKDDCTKTCK
eukprot:g3223.t1